MYLGINGKTPSFGDSDELKCVIDLPGAKSSEIAINCTEFVLEVSSPKL
jgi:HSP20 family molecular chaperone IbpA